MHLNLFVAHIFLLTVKIIKSEKIFLYYQRYDVDIFVILSVVYFFSIKN